MKPIAPEEAKAFIDDIAVVQAKHGIDLDFSYDLGGIVFLARSEKLSKVVDAGLSKRGIWILYPTTQVLEVVVSIDPQRLTAHDAMKVEEGLTRSE